ncbi:helix-turn-helix transcriptional regulator [Hymenobacter sp. BT664]|uniref:Helix-turn-helix transcriptional regulator n=1 Tax=Hymenobacter montanus TaxID=2771359 RepID=A0A927BE75_9BACT|nr:helix-turn-helix transcriptional regulator [Hymenobacter montanus]MBD2769192.1 helix-turn-helix transcriptional regulator [Hymenobacter montanus]
MTLSFNIYLFCVAFAVANLLLTAVLLFVLKKARNRKANLALALFLLCLAGSFLSDILLNNNFFQRYPQLMDYDSFLTLALGPLLYFYILYQTRPDMELRPIHLLHLLPLVGYFIILWDFFTSSSAIKRTYISLNWWEAIAHYFLATCLLKAQLLLYGIVSYRLLQRHGRVIQELASAVENLQLRWLRNVLLAVGGLFVVWLVSNLFRPAGYLLGFGVLFFSYWIAYHALSQEYLFEPASVAAVLPIIQEEPEVRYRTSTLTPEDIRTLMERVAQHMAEVRPYLEPELSLARLAAQLQLNPHYLSQVLNEGFGESFYKFVNRHRVQESQRLLLDPALQHYSMLGIAYEAGFSAKSTFYKVFKEVAGCSPSEFVSKNK